MKLTLEQFETQCADNNLSVTDWFDTTYGLFKDLEALQQPKSCEGCKHWIASWEDVTLLNNKNLQSQIKTHITNLKASGVGKCKDRSLENINKEKHKSYYCNRYEAKEQ